jgi:hypothetical protein
MSAVLRITPLRDLPCPHPAQRSLSRHPAAVFAAPWRYPMAHACGNQCSASGNPVTYSAASRSITSGFRPRQLIKPLIPQHRYFHPRRQLISRAS